MENKKYRLPSIKCDDQRLTAASKDIYSSMFSLEKTHSSIYYQKYSNNQIRKKKNDLEKLKKEILKKFRF